MAKCTVNMPDDFLNKLSKLGNKTDEITAEVLEAGGEVMLNKIKSNLHAVVGVSGRSTGELENSLGLSSVKQDKNGNSNIKVGFAEPRSDGGSNAKIANIIEYGKHNQPARPFLKPAKTSAKNDCMKAMTDKLEEEIGKL